MPRRVAVVTAPAQNSHSSARLLSDQPHQPLRPLMLMRQLAGTQRAAIGDLAANLGDEIPALAAEAGNPLIDAPPVLGPRHAPAEQRLQPDRQQRGLMAPIFEQRPLAAAISERVQILGPVASEARKRRQQMGAGEHVDAVDLQHAEPLDHPAQIALGRLGLGARLAEALRPQGDAPCLGRGKRIGAARLARSRCGGCRWRRAKWNA